MTAIAVTPKRMRADQARHIPIADYLERSGIKPARVTRQGRELWYSSPIREGDSSPSFKVDTLKNLWFDHGIAKGGNIIDLVIEMRRVTVKEALAILGSGYAGSIPVREPLSKSGGAPAGEKENETSLELVSERDIEHPALVQYLDARCIDMAIACRWLKELRYRRQGDGKVYFALGFKCGGGYDARSPVFKCFVGMGKTISTINFVDKGTVAVFEGVYDYLTWLAMRELAEPDCGVVILHSISLRERAMHAINEHGFGRVLLYLDRDRGGSETTEYFKHELGHRNVVDRSATYQGFKDLNEWWVALGHKA